jgi:hypothetical protein
MVLVKYKLFAPCVCSVLMELLTIPRR